MALDTYKITSGEVAQVHMEAVQGDALTGTVLQNKQRFDLYPDLIVSKFNALCDYVGEQSPSGDSALDYTQTEINSICTILGCTESSITM